jgi:hypothetical protein
MEQVNPIKKAGRPANANSVRQRIIALEPNGQLVLTPSDSSIASVRTVVTNISFDYARRYSVNTDSKQRLIIVTRRE